MANKYSRLRQALIEEWVSIIILKVDSVIDDYKYLEIDTVTDLKSIKESLEKLQSLVENTR